jgi:hypothetical protein
MTCRPRLAEWTEAVQPQPGGEHGVDVLDRLAAADGVGPGRRMVRQPYTALVVQVNWVPSPLPIRSSPRRGPGRSVNGGPG